MCGCRWVTIEKMVGDFSEILNLVGDRSPMTPMVAKPLASMPSIRAFCIAYPARANPNQNVDSYFDRDIFIIASLDLSVRLVAEDKLSRTQNHKTKRFLKTYLAQVKIRTSR
jgi:hypothetical protein